MRKNEKLRTSIRLRIQKGQVLLRYAGVPAVACTLLDLSEGGCRCAGQFGSLEHQVAEAWERVLEAGRPVQIELTFPPYLNRFPMEAEVRTASPIQGGSVEVGLKFRNVASGTAATLNQIMIAVAAGKVREAFTPEQVAQASQYLVGARSDDTAAPPPPLSGTPAVERAAKPKPKDAPVPPSPAPTASPPAASVPPPAPPTPEEPPAPKKPPPPEPKTLDDLKPKPKAAPAAPPPRPPAPPAPPAPKPPLPVMKSLDDLKPKPKATPATPPPAPKPPLPVMKSLDDLKPKPKAAPATPPPAAAGAPAAPSAPSEGGPMAQPGPAVNKSYWENPFRGKRVGEVLVQMGKLDPPQIEDAVQKAKAAQLQLGRYLLREGMVTPEELCRALALQSGLPMTDLSDAETATPIGDLFPFPVLAKHEFVPIENSRVVMCIAAANPLPKAVIAELEKLCQKKLEVFLAQEDLVLRALDRLRPEEREQDRRYNRYQVALPITYQFCNRLGRLAEMVSYNGRTMDVSEGGLQVEGPASKVGPPDDIRRRGLCLRLTIICPNFEVQALCDPRFIKVREKGGPDEFAWSMGLRILEMTNEDRRKLKEICIALGRRQP
jgi:hypothetical protein